jgi:hypothetical protein
MIDPPVALVHHNRRVFHTLPKGNHNKAKHRTPSIFIHDVLSIMQVYRISRDKKSRTGVRKQSRPDNSVLSGKNRNISSQYLLFTFAFDTGNLIFILYHHW